MFGYRLIKPEKLGACGINPASLTWSPFTAAFHGTHKILWDVITASEYTASTFKSWLEAFQI